MIGDPRLCWVDVETTGLDPDTDLLLEVGFAITTADLDPVASRNWVLRYNADNLASRRRDSDPVVQAMHDTSGLWDECWGPAALWPYATAEEIASWLAGHDAFGLVWAGSSVHFDLAWLGAWMGNVVSRRTNHRVVDVSSVKELARRWAPAVAASTPGSRKRHRALPDIVDSIAELGHYRAAGMWTQPPRGGSA